MHIFMKRGEYVNMWTNDPRLRQAYDLRKTFSRYLRGIEPI